MGVVVIGFIVLVIISAGVVVAALQYRKLLREAKNYERSLKMVPLLIHLPPTSEDIEGSSRDKRDLIDEEIAAVRCMASPILGIGISANSASTSRDGRWKFLLILNPIFMAFTFFRDLSARMLCTCIYLISIL